ncbi:hypothetical protein AX16_006090 [Volvariella volvacea WC 439]|nr:hypothetical protein AX16_006090 [Volvariella volvacea WC 439]
MDLSLEAYRNIVNHVGSRADIVALCGVSRGFKYVAERALYNTLYMRNYDQTMALCRTLADTPRLAVLVEALTIYALDGGSNGGSGDGENSEDDKEDDDDDGSTSASADEGQEDSKREPQAMPDNYWDTISRALQQTTQLRYLNIHVNSTSTSNAWILSGCTFQLRSFHCDLDWDRHLVGFLRGQKLLDDLYILDYNDSLGLDSSLPVDAVPATATSSAAAHTTATTVALSSSSDDTLLPTLSTLECTFTEAANVLVPSRPITHLKTCLSRPNEDAKRTELKTLFGSIKNSTRRLVALDIADSAYDAAFSMELLELVVGVAATREELRYLGTLVLPIGGTEVWIVFFSFFIFLLPLCVWADCLYGFLPPFFTLPFLDTFHSMLCCALVFSRNALGSFAPVPPSPPLPFPPLNSNSASGSTEL